MKTQFKVAAFLLTGALALPVLANDSSAAPAADNTAVNKNANVTAEQSGMSKVDTDLTRRIRQDIMKDKSLSTYARNVKIVSVNGTVTMKGPVRTADEEAKLLSYARAAAGTINVVDEVTITPEQR